MYEQPANSSCEEGTDVLDVQQIESWDARYSGTQAMHRTQAGIELYYEHRGEGPWLTIVSSAFVVSTAWRNFTSRLVQSNSVLTYDLRNQGASTPGDGSYPNHLSDLESLLDGLGVQQTYLLGVSLATLLCRDFVVQNPERVKGMILCGPAISPYQSLRRSWLIRAWMAALESGGPGALFDAFYPLVFGDRTVAQGGSAAYLALRERFLTLNSKAQLRENLRGTLEADDDPEKLRAIGCPVLLLTGDNDFSMGRSSLHDLAALIPDARVRTIERCGHIPYFEAPEQFETLVQRFVTEVESRPGAATSV
jgi:pimeloyl-ACP methyl ester carboxylesterase